MEEPDHPEVTPPMYCALLINSIAQIIPSSRHVPHLHQKQLGCGVVKKL